MQRYDFTEKFTQIFDVDVDSDAEFAARTCSIPLFGKVKMVWYIKMGYTNENANFTHNVGLVDMKLGS